MGVFVTAQVLAARCGCSEKTVLAHVRQMEREGHHVRARIGRPVQINYNAFMAWAFPGWKEEGDTWSSNSADCDAETYPCRFANYQEEKAVISQLKKGTA